MDFFLFFCEIIPFGRIGIRGKNNNNCNREIDENSLFVHTFSKPDEIGQEKKILDLVNVFKYSKHHQYNSNFESIIHHTSLIYIQFKCHI